MVLDRKYSHFIHIYIYSLLCSCDGQSGVATRGDTGGAQENEVYDNRS